MWHDFDMTDSKINGMAGHFGRQLRKEREFRWAVGKQVRCWLAGGSEVRGRLTEVTPERLVLDRDGERTELGRAAVTKARLEAEVRWPRKA